MSVSNRFANNMHDGKKSLFGLVGATTCCVKYFFNRDAYQFLADVGSVAHFYLIGPKRFRGELDRSERLEFSTKMNDMGVMSKRFWKSREKFQKKPIEAKSGKVGNPHRALAGERRTASYFCNSFITEMDMKIYSESNSISDQDLGHQGSRLYYGFKDLTLEAKDDELTRDHIVKMIDVDYYLSQEDIDSMIHKSGGIIMYTNQPSQVASFGENGHTLIGETFTDWYAGGARYEHRLWDWQIDKYTSVTRNNCGRIVGVTECVVEHRSLGNKHLVLILPRVRFDARLWLDSYLLEDALDVLDGNPNLERLVSTDHGNGIFSLKANSLVSFFRLGSDQVYEMPTSDFNNCLAGARSKNVSLPVLESLTGNRNAYHLRSVFLEMEERRDQTMRFTNQGEEPRSFMPLYEGLDIEQARVPGSTCCIPVVDGAFVAAEGPSSDEAVVQRRVEAVRAVNSQDIDPKFKQYAAEFVEVLKDHCGVSIPATLDAIVEAQTGSKFKAYAAAADAVYVDLMWKSFQKAEAYPEIKDPRNISNVDKKHVVRYLCYTSVLSAVLKTRTHWYAFGAHPRDVAERLHNVIRKNGCVSETDYSRYDGTLGAFLRSVEQDVFQALFEEEFAEEIGNLFLETLYNDIRTKYGRYYNNGTGRLSGSACTSVGNTIVNAIANFICLRACGLSIGESWEALGLYGGDDGVTFYPDPQIAEEVMLKLDLKFKVSLRVPGESVGFLGRFYTDPWSHTGSHHDIKRAVSKLHYSTTNVQNASFEQMCWRKAISLYVTDSTTPVLGDWARAVLRIIPDGKWQVSWFDEGKELGFDRFPGKTVSQEVMDRFKEPVYPGLDECERDKVLREFIDSSPIDLDDYNKWLVQLMKAKKLSEFPQPLWIESPSPASLKHYPVVVDDTVIGPKMSKPPAQHCYKWKAGTCTRGSKCHYVHDPKLAKSAEVCRKYRATGKCSYGDKCQYIHVGACRAFQKGECKLKDCKFAHFREG